MGTNGDIRKGATICAAVAAMTLLLGACGNDADRSREATPGQSNTGRPEISDDFFTEPWYLGRTVTVTASVNEVIGPTSFVLSGQQYGDDSLLVVSARAMDVDAGEHVRVTGTVQRFEYARYSGEFGLAEDATDYTAFEGEAVLIADPASRSPSPPG